MIALDPRSPLALLLAFAAPRSEPVLPCRCDDDAVRECSGGGLPRTPRGLCSCRCHGAETAPPADEATD